MIKVKWIDEKIDETEKIPEFGRPSPLIPCALDS